jgi:hypothetical protein
MTGVTNLQAIVSERTREGIAAKRAWLASQKPTAAVGRFPYKHRTVAQVDAEKAS